MPATSERALLVILGAVLVLFGLRLVRRPLGWLIIGLYRILLGGAVVWLGGFAARGAGLEWALNPGTAAVAGFLGIPGVLLLAAVSWLLL